MDKTDEFTFSTGITVKFRRVSPFLVNEIARAMPEPEPPVQEVELDGEKKREPNPADPEYIERLAEHRALVKRKQMEFILRRAVIADENEMRAAVDAVRAEWKKEFNTDLEETDPLLAYIKYVCAGATDDYWNLILAIQDRSHPTERGIAAEAKTFQGDVQGT